MTKLTRNSFFNNADYHLLLAEPTLGVEVFSCEKDASFYVIGFKGRAIKPAFHSRFVDSEAAEEYVKAFIEKCAKDKAEKAAKPIKLKMGDVLRCSWGYEQTNIDYYQVVGFVGKRSVELRQINKNKITKQPDIGTCTPIVDDFISDAFTLRVGAGGDYVKLSSYQHAFLKPFDIVDGVKTFKNDNWTSYA